MTSLPRPALGVGGDVRRVGGCFVCFVAARRDLTEGDSGIVLECLQTSLIAVARDSGAAAECGAII
jgi:hypothetical protein